MKESLRNLIRQRANDCCEYCRLPQQYSPLARLQIEHIIPRKHGGTDDDQNLALACVDGNLHKGSNLTGIDPESSHIVELYNPRTQEWDEHFRWEASRVIGRTASERATVRVLEINSYEQISFRETVGLPT